VNDQVAITIIALAYDAQEQPFYAKRKQAVNAFKSHNFPNGKRAIDQALPSLPPELIQLKADLNSLALQSRDQVQETLGDKQFALLDQAIRSKFQHDYNTPASNSGIEVKQ